MKQTFFAALTSVLLLLAGRFAFVSFVDFGDIPLRMNIAVWLMGVLCGGFALHSFAAARAANQRRA